jgi:hypothetical protein
MNLLHPRDLSMKDVAAELLVARVFVMSLLVPKDLSALCISTL